MKKHTQLRFLPILLLTSLLFCNTAQAQWPISEYEYLHYSIEKIEKLLSRRPITIDSTDLYIPDTKQRIIDIEEGKKLSLKLKIYTLLFTL